MQDILKQLGLEAVNEGTWIGATPLADTSACLLYTSDAADDYLTV